MATKRPYLPDEHKDEEAAGIHGSATAATANKLVHRDAAGRSKVADPGADTDIDTQGARNTAITTHANITTEPIHGSDFDAVGHTLVHRDTAGRAQIGDPDADADIDNKGARNTAISTHAAVTETHGATGAVVGTTNAQTLTNKTIIAGTNVVEEITTTASDAAPAPTGGSLRNFFTVTGQAEAATFAAPSGVAANGNRLIIRIKDNGTARALAWNAIYRRMEFALPTTTVISKTMYLGFIYNQTDTKWDLVAMNHEA